MSYSSGGGSGSLHTDNDVALSNPVTGHVLSYDGGISKWKNAAGVTTVANRTGDITLGESDITGLTTDLATRARTTGGGQETVVIANSGAAYTVNAVGGNLFFLTLTANCTLSLSGAMAGMSCALTIALVQDGTGSRTVSWPGSVKWPGGTAPTLTSTAAKTDFVSLLSVNGGTTWYGFTSGLNY